MKDVFAAYAPSMRKFVGMFALTCLLMVIGVVAKNVYPFCIRLIVDALSTGDSGPMLERYLVYIAVAFLSTHVVWLAYDLMIMKFETNVMQDLDKRSFAAVLNQSMQFFENAFAGSLVKSATRFRNAFEVIADAWFFQIGRSLVMIIITLVVFGAEQPLLAGVFCLWATAFVAFNLWTAKIRYRLSIEEADADSACGGAFADAFGNAATVKTFGREREESERFAGYVDTCFAKRTRAWRTTVWIMRGQGFLMSMLELTIIWQLIVGWRAGTVTLGDFVLFQTYVVLLVHQLWDFGSQLHRVYQQLAEAKEMASIMMLKPTVSDLPGAQPLYARAPSIEFSGATFRYVDGGPNVINHLNLSIAPGEKVALVGRSGGGKSTIVKLIQRLYDLQRGSIRVFGQDIRNVLQSSLRRKVAIVSQDPQLFHRSVLENIRFARPDATNAEVIEAARRAHALEFIHTLPSGMETLVGERGVKLSGGQRQRVALARAILANSQIVLIDEGTSALDSETENFVQEAMQELMHGRTVVTIAHRLSTIAAADRIVVIEEGNIAEEGTHVTLLEQGGLYAALWSRQSNGYVV